MEFVNSAQLGAHKLAPPTNAARDRDPNCIEMHLKNIEAELSEAVNSSENLADKLKNSPKPPSQTGVNPSPGDLHGRLEQILNMVHGVNQELGRAHSAISG